MKLCYLVDRLDKEERYTRFEVDFCKVNDIISSFILYTAAIMSQLNQAQNDNDSLLNLFISHESLTILGIIDIASNLLCNPVEVSFDLLS